ncbi:MAG: UDP-N-acetylmuramate--L-alanine ligase [Gemmatimonadales bacterium]|nr:MAG: UDP-N-acetylmuramate--L-alanine ligase [Gemmatimonadales bacterium]
MTARRPFTWPRDEDAPVHFMGIGGAGMCALAEAVARAGGKVSGCDADPGRSARRLAALGIPVAQGHDPAHVEDASALVVSAAIPPQHPEILAARERGLPVLKRAEALARWVNRGRVLGVAGTHGKTTTTALLTEILMAADRAPTGFVGAEVVGWGSNLHPGDDQVFVVEADEYDRSFLHLRPEVAVVTNMEEDHLDIYGSLEGVREGFRSYLRQVVPGGAVVACADDPGAGALLQGLPRTVTGVSYGFSAGSLLRGSELEVRDGVLRFQVAEGGRDRGHLVLHLPGIHNARNALAAAAAARHLGVEWPAIREGLVRFRGVRRRFQRLSPGSAIEVIDDYAHHPTEVAATVAAALEAFPGRRLVAVFQPHLYTRTQTFHAEFGRVLAPAASVWVTDVYPAREAPIPGVDGSLVVQAALDAGAQGVRYHADLASLSAAVASQLRSGDVCLVMGAGSIERVGPEIVTALGGTHA